MSGLRQYLKQYFGYNEFRTGQEEIISSVINCSDTLVVMPTGGGKSLCYQLPALVMPGTAIIISPLIALMKDQVDSLLSNGIPVALINSTLDYNEVINRFEAARRNEYKMIFVAPERLESKIFLKLLTKLDISFVAVDEAHCISEWGHDFRPSYLNISKIFDFIDRVPVIALTATATDIVQTDIAKTLNLSNCNKFVKGFDRPNLNYVTENTKFKIDRIIDIISETKMGSTIIYCGSRKRTEQFTNELKSYKINIESYHAGLKQQIRESVQNRFMNDKTKIIAATNAFGMGIDKADVRNVIHVDFTQTIESYYQEAGRAGRDGLESNCILLYQPEDIHLQHFFIDSTYPSRTNIETLFSYIKKTTFDGNLQPLPELANNTGLSLKATESILKLLERNKILVKDNFNQFASIRILTDRERLTEYYSNTNENRKICLEAILRSTPADAFQRTIPIDVKSILINHQIKSDVLDEAIRAFNFAGIFEIKNYNHETSGNQYILENENELTIDFNDLQKRREYAYYKLNKVIEYADTSECKRNFILNYFDDKEVDGTCKKCSSCTNERPLNNKFNKSKFVEDTVLRMISEFDNTFSIKDISSILNGKLSKELRKNQDEYIDFLGTCGDFTKGEIENVVLKLNLKRLIDIDKTKTIRITNSGKVKINKLVGV